MLGIKPLGLGSPSLYALSTGVRTVLVRSGADLFVQSLALSGARKLLIITRLGPGEAVVS